MLSPQAVATSVVLSLILSVSATNDAHAGRFGTAKTRGRSAQLSGKNWLMRISRGRLGTFTTTRPGDAASTVTRAGWFRRGPQVRHGKESVTVKRLTGNVNARLKSDGTMHLWENISISGSMRPLEALDVAGGRSLLTTRQVRRNVFGGTFTSGDRFDFTAAELMGIIDTPTSLKFSDTRVELTTGGFTLIGDLRGSKWRFRAGRRLGIGQTFTTRNHYKISNETPF